MMDPSEIAHFLARFVMIFTELLSYAIILQVIVSWVAPGGSRYTDWLTQMVEPLLKPFGWARIGMMDFSPVAALLALYLLQSLLIEFLGKFL